MTIEEFDKIELCAAKVLSAERVTGSEKLLRLEIDAGDKNAAGEPIRRQLVAGIGKAYEPEPLIGREIIIVANLDPRQFKISPELVLESQGMLLAVLDADGKPALLCPEREVPPGTRAR